jgi:hypothetical protein
MSSLLRLLALGPALAVFLSGCSSSGRTNPNAPAGSRSAPESTAALPSDAEQTVRLLVGRAHGIEPGMVFRIAYGAVPAGDLVVTRVFRDESLARFVCAAQEVLGPCEVSTAPNPAGGVRPCSLTLPWPGVLLDLACWAVRLGSTRREPEFLPGGKPSTRLWTIEASEFANSQFSSWHQWGFRIDESGTGYRWDESPENARRIRVPREVVARIRSACERTGFDQLRELYTAGAHGFSDLRIRVTHGESEKRVEMRAPWAIAFNDIAEPDNPDLKHARRFLQLWDVITEVIPPPPDTSPWNVPAIEARVESIDTAGRKVVLSAGRHEGVVHGMRFYVSRGDCYIGEVEVRRVEMHRCTASVVRISESREIQPGDRATTHLWP